MERRKEKGEKRWNKTLIFSISFPLILLYSYFPFYFIFLSFLRPIFYIFDCIFSTAYSSFTLGRPLYDGFSLPFSYFFPWAFLDHCFSLFSIPPSIFSIPLLLWALGSNKAIFLNSSSLFNFKYLIFSSTLQNYHSVIPLIVSFSIFIFQYFSHIPS